MKTRKTRWKIPLSSLYLVRGSELEETAEIIITLEKDVLDGLRREKIRSAITEKLRHQIAVMTGNIPAPLCPKCGKPKKAGGIQWIDHAGCCRPAKKEPGTIGGGSFVSGPQPKAEKNGI